MTPEQRAAIEAIVDTLEARADARQPLSPREMLALADALRNIAEPVDGTTRHLRTHLRTQATATILRPTWGGQPA